MFEHEIHNQGTPSQNSPEPPLFKNYEMRSWTFSTRIYQIFGISLVLNIVAILVLGQSNLLTVKGCDSPLIGGVCDVLDTVYVGSKLFGTDTEYIDADYTKTELGPDDEITYIEIKEEPLYYPANYFEIANANDPKNLEIAGINDFSAPIAPVNPTFPSVNTPLEATPQVTPTPNDNVILGPLPGEEDDNRPAKTPPFSTGRTGKRPKGFPRDPGAGVVPVAPKPTPNPTPEGEVAEVCSPDPNGVCLNKRPLRKYAEAKFPEIGDPTKVKLDAPFTVVMSAELTKAKDGTVVLAKPKRLESKDDPQMRKFAEEGILAVGDSGWFGYLGRFEDVKRVKISVIQDGTEFKASVTAERGSEELARQAASALNTMISVGKFASSKPDDIVFLEKASVSSDGKTFTVSFAISKEVAIEMIKKKLNEALEKEKENSTAQTQNPVQNTAKK